MPVAITEIRLRGLLAQRSRELNKAMGDILQSELKPLVLSAGFNWPLPPGMQSRVLAVLKAELYPTSGPGQIAEFSFEYWFNYFYKELPASVQLLYAERAINDDGSLRSEGQVPNKMVTFKEMLNLGFKRFQASDHLSAAGILAHAKVEKANVLQRNDVRILFRGDGRGPEQIRGNGGTKPQTQIATLAASRNMSNSWHPFNYLGNAVWVRNGEVNKDNCLFSAVSVTPQFEIATKFPFVDDLLKTNPSVVGSAWVEVRNEGTPAPVFGPAPRPAPQTEFERARAQFDQRPAPQGAPGTTTLTLRASQTNIYGVRMRGAFNTQTYQKDSEFPEYASDDLDWSDHLVWISITRIHFGEQGNDGHIIVVNDHRWLQTDNVIRAALLGPVSLTKLKEFVALTAWRGSADAGGIVSLPGGVEAPDWLPRMVRIVRPFMQGRAAPPTPVVSIQRPAGHKPGRVNVPGAFTQAT